jgi:N-carbamoyl-L-amino-acid hydrolase
VSVIRLLEGLADLGRDAATGGYRRFAWTPQDAAAREWFADEAGRRGMDLHTDRAGTLWAWWGDPDAAVAAGRPGVAVGSHLDSVPDGGAYDGPLGVASGFAAVDLLRERGWTPSRPVAVACFADEEGARFGVACAGSRLLTGSLTADGAAALRDADGVSWVEAAALAGLDAASLGRDDEALARIGTFVELHVEQGRGLVELGRPVGVATMIRPHGRWRLELEGRADHAGTTALRDRRDPMLDLARLVLSARSAAERQDALATVGRVLVGPNAVNAIPGQVTAWLDARADHEAAVRAVVDDLRDAGFDPVEESWTAATVLDDALRERVAADVASACGGAPALATGAGHDAGVLARAGIPAAMLFVRNPTGVSHSPAEHAEDDDCEAGVRALAGVVADLAGPGDGAAA